MGNFISLGKPNFPGDGLGLYEFFVARWNHVEDPVNIVVVAKNGFTRSCISVHLRSDGHVLTEAEPTCLLDVLTIMREAIPQAVILDQEMPECPWETVVRCIREDPLLSGTPILLVGDPEQQEAAARLGRWGHLRFMVKPIQAEALLQDVRRLAQYFHE